MGGPGSLGWGGCRILIEVRGRFYCEIYSRTTDRTRLVVVVVVMIVAWRFMN